MAAFIGIVGSLKETLQKILIRGEFDEDLDYKQMYCNARLVEMLVEFSKEVHKSVVFSENFLVEEMQILEEANGIQLPNFLPHYVFLYLLKKKVNNISDLPIRFVNKMWDYLEIVCFKVLIDHCENYPQLLSSMRKATQNVMAKMKNKFVKRVVEMIEMEKITDYTCDPDFISSWTKLKAINNDQFAKAMCNHSNAINMEEYGMVNVKHLFCVPTNIRDQAFDLKMKMTAYWKIVMKRMVDCVALHLRFIMQKVVNKEMEMEIVNEVMVHGGGIEKMLEEPPSLAKSRERLQRSIGLLQESKGIIEQVMDEILVTN